MAQQKMQCAIQRTHADNQKLLDGGKGYTSRKTSKEDNFRKSLEDSELSTHHLRRLNPRYTIVTFLALESDGRGRIVTLPVHCLNHPNQVGYGAKMHKDGLHLVSPPSLNLFKVGQQKTRRGPPSDVNYSLRSCTARSFPVSNLQQRSHNRRLTNKVTKLKESGSFPCQRSITCSNSSGLISKGSDAIKSFDTLIHGSEVENTEKRTSRKKARKRGKQNKKPSWDTGSTEPEASSEYGLGSAASETCVNNDIDHGDGLVLCASSPEVSSSDGRVNRIHFRGNSNGIIGSSESTMIYSSYTDEVDVSKATVSSLVHNFPGEHLEVGVRKKDRVFPFFDREVEGTHNIKTSDFNDMPSKGLSSMHDTSAVDSVSVGSNSDDDTNAGHYTKPFDEEGSGVSLAESPDFNSRKGHFSCENTLNLAADACEDSEEATHSSKNLCIRDTVVAVPMKRGKQIKTVPSSSSTHRLGATGNMHGRTGKENSVWQKVQRNQVDHSNYKSKKVNMLTKTEDTKLVKDKVPRKSKGKTSPGSKREYSTTPRRPTHPNKATSEAHAKISVQGKELPGILAQTNDKKGSSSISRSHSKIACPQTVLQSCIVDCTSSESVHEPQVFPVKSEPPESVCHAVSSMKNGGLESKESSLPKPCGSLDDSNMLEVQSPVYLPHLLFNRATQMGKEMSFAEHSKPTNSSASTQQKWVPIGTKDCGLTTAAKTDNISIEELGAYGDKHCTLINTDDIVKGQSSGSLDYASHKDEIRTVNEYTVFADLDKITQAVNDACRIQLASEGVQKATGGPIAEFERLLHFTSPVISHSQNFASCQTCSREQLLGALLCRHETPNISLGCLWQWYEKHGSYGLEIRTEDHSNSKRLGVDRFAFRAYFVPFLSAIQLFRSCKSHSTKNGTRASTPGVLHGHWNGESSEISHDVGHCSIFSVLVPQPRSSNANILQVGNDAWQEEPYLASDKEVSSIQSDNMTFSNDLELLYEYFETEPPQQRRPLYEKIQELVRGDETSHCKAYGDPSRLTTINLHDLHPKSWYAVAWYPIYRIPDGNLRAAFLTYHSLGQWSRRSAKFDFSSMDSCVISPVVGLQSYNAQSECWFQLRTSAASRTAETVSSNSSGILKDRLRTLEETASLMARAVVSKGDKKSKNRHPDYEFFLSRRR